MNSLIFSADDFGKSQRANKNILDLVKLGKIQRVSILINGSISKAEIKELLDSKVKLDIHLVLPDTDYKKEQDKVIKRTFVFLAKLLAGKTTLVKVRNSWQNQIEKFRKFFGKYPEGLNSHEHVHFFPPYFKIALKLNKKYRIPRIRAASERVINNSNKIGRILKILNQIDKKYFTRYMSTAYRSGKHIVRYKNLTCLDWINNFEKFISNLPKGTIEIICHPERKGEYKTIKNLN